MGIKFKVTERVQDYVLMDDKFKHVTAEKKYEVHNYDDLQNLILTLIDFGTNDLEFKVSKMEVDD